MDFVKRRNRIIINVSASLIFAVLYISSLLSCFFEVIKPVSDENGFINANYSPSPVYIVLSCLFAAVLALFCAFGMKLKSRLMVFLTVCYEIVFIVGITALGLAMNGSDGIFESKAVIWLLSAALGPVYGFFMLARIAAVVYFVLLAAFSVFSAVKVLGKNK